jgi:toxin HigB-1
VIVEVKISQKAQKELRKVPDHVLRKLREWITSVQSSGLHNTRKVPGFHDEPLQGQWRGYRSIRLSKSYRAFYTMGEEGHIEFILIERVNKHDY